MNALARLRRFSAIQKQQDRCVLCGSTLEMRHPHIVEAGRGRPLCACTGCAIIFDHDGGRFRRVPDRVVRLRDFRLTDEAWKALQIPVGMTFLQKRASDGTVLAFYPSPLGAVESSVSDEAWRSVLRENPVLQSLQEDVEALLIDRTGARREYFIAPIDECHGLIGLIRRRWRGFTGGEEMTQAVEEFFRGLRARSGDSE